MLRKAILTLLFILSLCAQAQTGKLFDANTQLSSSFTNQVYLDRDGFIWVATRNGLNKYDGYQFHILKKEKGQNTGMASNYVNCILQDNDGLFYIGMYGALQTYDGVRFSDVEVKDLDGNVIPCYVTSFLQCKNGRLLAGTSGHGLLQFSDHQHAQQIGGPLKGINSVQYVEEDNNCHLWLVTEENGLIEYDGKNIKKYFDDETMRNAIRRICKDSQGNIYVGTHQHGVYIHPAKGGDFQHIDISGAKTVFSLYCSHNGQLFFGYDGQGIDIYDPKTGKLTENPYYSNEVDLSHAKVASITEDNGGNLWIGMLQKGIFLQPTESTGFNYMGYRLGPRNTIGQACVTSTLIDSKGNSWIGTDKDGLYQLDASHRRTNHFSTNFPGTILSIEEDKRGRIWVGSYQEGCGWIDANGTYHPLSLPQGRHISVFGIKCDTKGDMWISTMGNGLLHTDADGKLIKAYVTNQSATTDRKQNCIVNNYISQMSISPDGKRIYTATTMGICCLDIERDSWINVFDGNTINYGQPTRIAKEYNGRLWIGTNDGLLSFDLRTKKQELLTKEQGLTDNGISSIEQDKSGRLWISTDHGLNCYTPKTGLMGSYFVDNGLQSNEFSDGASWTSPDGWMLFGGVGGVTWFDPAQITNKKWDGKVLLTDFIVNNQPINSSTISDGYHICDTTVIAATRFQLGHRDNHFAIQLSTLSYVNPEHITYLYSINGEPYARLQPGVNEITFTHLSPGTYRFRIKAERNGQTTPDREFIVFVHAPWYRTAWAYCLYLILGLFFLWHYIRYRRNREKEMLQLQEHIHAEEMGEAKLRFFMNISHEIRTPMTLILAPLLSLMKDDNDPRRKSIYEMIKRNSERILHLINQMMDLRKIDKGQMQMRMSETDLIDFIGDIHTLFMHQANSKQITLTYEHDTDKLPVWIDRQNFDKVIVNILSNAFKFTPTGGKIGIRVTHDDQNANIAISDNGEKIPEDKLDKIFERFYQTPSSTNDRNVGTGIGLDLTRSLVELHYGAINAHNLDEGCEFIVSIPLGCAHLKPEEMVEEKDIEETTSLLDMNETEEDIPVEMADDTPNNRPSIIIAEDDDEIRDYLELELSRDYNVHSCTNGRDALAEAYRTHPDLIISDVMMPEMDGNTLCSQLKHNPQTNHIPVILLTAKNRDEDKLEGLETGADAYIVKPVNLDILSRTISNLINARRLMRQKYEKTEPLEEQVEDVKMKSPDEKLMERVMSTINKQLNNSDLSIDMIANEVGISRVHLHRKMKELTGQTPHDFIRTLRLKQAAHLLATQNMNITEVVYACGFSNAASFSTMFKSVYGMAPRDYMREHQK